MSRLLRRSQRLRIFKVIALLSLVRWWSILAVVSAMYLAACFVLNDPNEVVRTLSAPELHFTVFSTACMVASGFIINSFYDLERDSINRPEKVIFQRLISRESAFNFYFFFNTVGMILAFYVSKRVMLYNFLFGIALWFYSHKLDKRAFTANLSATVLTLAPFGVLTVLYRDVNFALFFYVGFLGIIELAREVIRDISTTKGDAEFGYRSVAIKYGIPAAKKVVYLLLLLVPLCVIGLYQTYAVNDGIGYFFALSAGLILLIGVLINKANTDKDYVRINRLFKLILTLGILSIPLL